LKVKRYHLVTFEFSNVTKNKSLLYILYILYIFILYNLFFIKNLVTFESSNVNDGCLATTVSACRSPDLLFSFFSSDFFLFPLFFFSHPAQTSHPLPLFFFFFFFFHPHAALPLAIDPVSSPLTPISRLPEIRAPRSQHHIADPLLSALPTLAGDPNARPNTTGAPGTLTCPAVHR
jgi:hypothetical protein